MSISCQALYNSVIGSSGTSVGSDRINSRFVTAVNRSLDRMSLAGDLATRHSHITGQNSTITSLDDEYEWILAAGVDFFLNKLGQRTSDPKLLSVVTSNNKTDWEDALGEYVAALSYIEQATDSNSIIGLGYVG